MADFNKREVKAKSDLDNVLDSVKQEETEKKNVSFEVPVKSAPAQCPPGSMHPVRGIGGAGGGGFSVRR